MQIIPIQKIGREKWNAFVDSCDQAWFYHLYDLIEAKAFWTNHTNASFAVLEDNENICAICPIHHIAEYRKKILPAHVLNSLGGIAIQNNYANTKREEKIWNFCKEHILDTYKSAGVSRIEFWLNSMIPSLRGENCPRVNPLVLRGLDNTLTQTWIIDLKNPEKDLLSAMAENYRTSLRKAEKAKITIRQADKTSEDMQKYYNLHSETSGRSGINPHPIAYMEKIWQPFLANGQCRILFAEHEEEIVSAINYACYKNAGAYWTGAASKKAYDIRANHLLHWHMLKDLKKDGYEWAEIGEAIFSGNNIKHITISDFKSRIGGTLYPYYKAEMKIQ